MKVKLAKSMSTTACAHGNIYIRLHDASDRIWAAGIMDVETALAFAERLVVSIAEARAGVGQCQGHA